MVLNHCGVVELGSFVALVGVDPGSLIGLNVATFKSCILGFQQLANLKARPGFLDRAGADILFFCL